MNILNKYFSTTLVSFFAGLILMLALSNSSHKVDVKKFKQITDSLQVANKKLTKSNDSLKNNIEKSSIAITSLNKKDESLKEKVGQLNYKIQSLKVKYEEANNHANNFGSLDIQRYFAELK
jgi:predicted nuclease with TOPRIM domain